MILFEQDSAALQCVQQETVPGITFKRKKIGDIAFVPTFVQQNSEMNARTLILFSSPICMFIPVVCMNWLLKYTVFQVNSIILQENVPRLNCIDTTKNTPSKS
jgi:hypothetical protein